MRIVQLVELYAECTAVYLTHPFNSLAENAGNVRSRSRYVACIYHGHDYRGSSIVLYVSKTNDSQNSLCFFGLITI